MKILTEHQSRALNYKQHISLTANAGSGKTFVLSKRYLEIALNEDVSLRNIAAITFTDKAAGELYKKIADQIEERIKIISDPIQIKKLERIRRQLVSANISTIHSFCIDILREHPVEAGIDANFSPIDEILSNELIELSVEEMIKNSLKDNRLKESLKYLIRIFASKSIFAQQMISLIKNRKNVLNISEKIYSKSEDEIAEFFHSSFLKLLNEIILNNKEYLIELLSRINQASLDDNPNNTIAIQLKQKIIILKSEQDLRKTLDSIFNICSDILTTNGTIKIKYLSSQLHHKIRNEYKLLKEFSDDLKNISIDNNHKEIELELAKFGKIILQYFNKALVLYSEKKQENGYIDFEDILLFTQKTLQIDSVRQSLSDKYKYIMVDEYQDTNEIQYQIFLPILDYLKKGNLFIVGDEKQSIYMFRDSELEIFDRTKKNISSSENIGVLLKLPDSFRMSPALCLFINFLFSKLFNKPNLMFNEVEHSNLVCARGEIDKGKIEILIAKCDEEEKSKDYEAELVAKRIIKLIKEEKINWCDAAVLCRKRKSFSDLEKVFIENKIPFLIVGGKGFFQRQSIYDIYNYFSFLLDTSNDTALIGMLRSPFFTLSDSAIFEISIQPGKSFWNKLHSLSSSKEELKSITQILNENLLLVKSYDITSMLRKILHETGYLAVLASKTNSIQELANIQKLIKVTINFNSQGFKTLYDYVNFVKDSIENTEDEAQAAVTDESNSVKIMTLHQAKGLEFPAVFLFRCDEYTQKDKVKTKVITVNKNWGLLTKIPYKNNYFSDYKSAPIIGISDLISEKKNIAELKRLFYVGVTRAIDYLFISASEKKDDNYNKESFMSLLLEGLNIDLCRDKFPIDSSLEFIKIDNGKYVDEIRNMKIDIPIIKELNENYYIEEADEITKEIKYLKYKEISDIPEGEIISATKMAVFQQCPLKYKLTYEHGFTGLYRNYKRWLSQSDRDKKPPLYEFNQKEDEMHLSSEEFVNEKLSIENAEVKGRIIHKILQKEIPQKQLDIFLDHSLKNEIKSFGDYDEISIKLKTSITEDLKNYFNSSLYKEIKSYNNYKNEYEVYVKEKDYFLYGIIDKLIIDNNKAIIIDYKTDDILNKDIKGRSESYLTQLKFYSYIISSLFKEISHCELKLIFIKHPDNPVINYFKMNEITSVKLEIEKMVYNIRSKNFDKNLNHCSRCLFADINNNCIVNN